MNTIHINGKRNRGLAPRLLYLIVSIWVLLGCYSCVKDVDFDQVDTLTLTPEYDIDFIYSDVDIETFITRSESSAVIIPEVTLNDTLAYDFLQDDFITENIAQVIITFEFENTIARDFDFSFRFLNGANQSIDQDYTINVLSGMGEDAPPSVTRREIILDRSDIQALSTAEQLATSIRAQNISRDLSGGVVLRSKALYFVEYQL